LTNFLQVVSFDPLLLESPIAGPAGSTGSTGADGAQGPVGPVGPPALPNSAELTLYVSPYGSDNSPGTGPGAAKLTIAAAIAGLNGVPGAVCVAPGTYTATDDITVPFAVHLIGRGAGLDVARSNTVLNFPAGKGLIITGGGSVVRGIALSSADNSVGTGVGIKILGAVGSGGGAVSVENVFVTKFGSHGISIDTTAAGNANVCRVTNSRIYLNGGDGLHLDGTNTNACTFLSVDCGYNTGWGIWNGSAGANNHIGAQLDGNHLGAVYDNGKGNKYSIYVERKAHAPRVSVPVPSTTGGTFAAGTYFWVVTTTDALGGESLRSNEVTAVTTGTTGSAALAWTQDTVGNGYKVYRGTATGVENVLVATIVGNATITYTDTGAAGTAGTPSVAQADMFYIDGSSNAGIIEHPTSVALFVAGVTSAINLWRIYAGKGFTRSLIINDIGGQADTVRNPTGNSWILASGVTGVGQFSLAWQGTGAQSNIFSIDPATALATWHASIYPAPGATYDLGLTGNRWRDVYVSGSVRVTEAANGKAGVATLAAGTVVVANTSVTATSRIQLHAQDNNTTGALRVSARTAGTSFTITSSNAADTGVVYWRMSET
jgi:hypothetical protein